MPTDLALPQPVAASFEADGRGNDTVARCKFTAETVERDDTR